jgi:hypothetical protein
MEDNIIYGVDISKEVTPVMVRDTIIDCFNEAHSDVLEEMKDYTYIESKEKIEEMKRKTVKLRSKKWVVILIIQQKRH